MGVVDLPLRGAADGAHGADWVRPLGIHYLACGRYTMEQLGIRALGEHLASGSGWRREFVDVVERNRAI